MPQHIKSGAGFSGPGDPPVEIREYIGGASTGARELSFAHMKSPAGWSEPGQRAAFNEYAYVLSGTLRVEYEDGQYDVGAGEVIVINKGEWVRLSTPGPDGAEYFAICCPAFSPDAVVRDPT